MKLSLTLGPRKPLDRSAAWGCFTANLACPGAGSLVARRRTGYAQMALAVIGLILQILALIWLARDWARIIQAMDEAGPEVGERFHSLGVQAGTLLWTGAAGLVCFVAGWLWSLGSGIAIVLESTTKRTWNALGEDSPPAS